MLSRLHVHNFKCFEQLSLELQPLTMLSGTNGGGKSSVIQALVLLAQTMSQREWGSSLLLEGPDLSLGSAGDVLNQRVGGKRLMLGADTAKEQVRWTFKAVDRRDLSMSLTNLILNGINKPLEEPLRWLLPPSIAESSTVVGALRRLSWITAERVGPRELLPLRDVHAHEHVGARGELAAGLLYWRIDDDVRTELCLPDEPRTLFHQVRAQMRAFFPGCDLNVSPIDGASAVALRLRSSSRSEFHRPQNVGFGLTQLFPILVAALTAKPGEILLIENPEVHLHPRAQQAIGTLLAKVAGSGVQVVVETHSDHVLNGVRLAVKRKDGLRHDQVAMHFFSPDAQGGPVMPVSPKLDADGRLDSWPDGFFDQLDVALSELL